MHPAAQAVVRAAQERQLRIPERGESWYSIGLGIEAEVEGETVLVGSELYLTSRGIALPDAARTAAQRAGTRGASTVFVARDGAALGCLAYADVPRPEARSVIGRLHASGVRHLVMVTGDQRAVAEAVAAQIGIDRVEAGVFPERKAEIVRALQSAGRRTVAVIGDGINDSPALAYADVSVSLQGGTDVARETADVVLHGSLHGLPEAVAIARHALGIIRQNLGIVGIPNTGGVLLAAAGLVTPTMATALNNGSAVAAALNGLRPLTDHVTPR
jgi:Cu2+-exporting ATPase